MCVHLTTMFHDAFDGHHLLQLAKEGVLGILVPRDEHDVEVVAKHAAFGSGCVAVRRLLVKAHVCQREGDIDEDVLDLIMYIEVGI